MTDTNAWIANRIRRARDAAGLTQAQLADRLERTQTAVSYWEAGKRVPGLDDLIEISSALERDVYFFLPPAEPHQPVSAILRAEAQRLASTELNDAVDRLLDDADSAVIPRPQVRVRSRQPAHTANELIELAGITEPPVDVDALAYLSGALVLKRRFPEALSGLVLEIDDGAIIGVNSSHAHVRQRFSLAHELGHHLLRHGERFHIDVTEGDPPDHDYRSERAANDFAAELLMPRRFVVPRFDAEPSPSGLARQFDVSEIAMGYRLVNLGLR